MTMFIDSSPRAEGTRASASFHELTVSAVESVCDDAVAVTFDVPLELAADFTFRAGQSLTLRRRINGIEHRRPYSICAATGMAPRIGVREIPGGLFSPWLVHEVREGDRIEVQAPSGSFGASADSGERHVCIAAGSGITPVLSIASTVLSNPSTQVTLLYGNRTTRSVMFAEELADLKNRHTSRLDLVHVLSREPRDVELLAGRLDRDRLRRLLPVLVAVGEVDHYWLCGPFTMLQDARSVLNEFGVDPARVHFELFYVDEPPPEVSREAGPLTGEMCDVTITLDGSSTSVSASRNVAILDTAQTVRSDLPFACRGGVCGTCRARVRFGEVEMRRNYALDDAEIQAGYVLTCQSYPISDCVTVDFDA